MDVVIFVAYASRTDAVALGKQMQTILSVDRIPSELLVIGEEATLPALSEASLVVSLGGDGTFLRAARIAHAANATVLGVNMGRVGFLVPVETDSLYQEILRFRDGTSIVERRVVLRSKVLRNAEEAIAINEIVLERLQPGHMVRVRIRIDEEEFLTYSADGVMVATPTGSTGYNFSAGGPVVAGGMNAFVVTPIAPHFTIDRSIVVASSSTIVMEVLDRPAAVVADGLTVATLEPESLVEISGDRFDANVVVPMGYGIGSRLRSSLREGHA